MAVLQGRLTSCLPPAFAAPSTAAAAAAAPAALPAALHAATAPAPAAATATTVPPSSSTAAALCDLQGQLGVGKLSSCYRTHRLLAAEVFSRDRDAASACSFLTPNPPCPACLPGCGQMPLGAGRLASTLHQAPRAPPLPAGVATAIGPSRAGPLHRQQAAHCQVLRERWRGCCGAGVG